MPIIKPKTIEKEVQLRLRLKESLVKEMQDYCHWSGIANYNDFVGECINYVLSKDKDWRIHKTKHQVND